MSENLLYLLGTGATWVGWFLAFAVVARLLAGLIGRSSLNLVSIAISGFAAAVCLAAGTWLSVLNGAKISLFHLPLVWVVMPFSGWVALIAGVLGVLRGAQWFGALPGDARTQRLRSSVVWLVVAAAFIWLYKSGTEGLQVLRGGIDLSPANAVAIALLIVAGSAGMKAAAQRSTSRGWSKALATHLMLIVGSVVFGLPFAFLLITSFKEDRDMSSPDGIVWVPKVQQTVQYWDRKDPVMEGTYEGRRVEGSIVSTSPDGTAKLEVTRPASMRGLSVDIPKTSLKEIPRDIPLVTGSLNGRPIQGKVIEELLDGQRRVSVTLPEEMAGREHVFKPSEVEPVRKVGLRVQNYTDALEELPPETANGLVYLKNTLIIVILSVIGTVLSSSVVAYAFARMHFPGRNLLFSLLLGTMMLPSAVTLLPKFLLFRSFGWINTLYPLWVPAFFASAFNVFLLRQFFKNIPSELEDAARIDGCNPARTFWSVMLPLVKPALAVIAIWAFMGAWNNFMDPLIYISSPDKMPLSYALQLFQGEHGGREPGMMMAFATMTMLPVLLLFFFAQKYFVEGVTLSGLGGR